MNLFAQVGAAYMSWYTRMIAWWGNHPTFTGIWLVAWVVILIACAIWWTVDCIRARRAHKKFMETWTQMHSAKEEL